MLSLTTPIAGSLCLFNSRSRNHAKITGVTIKMWIKLLAMPPMTGVASGFITSAPVRVLHMMGSKLATMVATVMTLGRSRKRAPLQSGYVTNYGESGTQLRNIAASRMPG